MAVIRIKNKDEAGSIPGGLTRGELAVNLSDRSLYVGGTVGNSIFISGVQSFNGATGDVLGAGLAGNTFTGLNHFQAGISAAGATLGTLIVHRGISASGGVTFHNNLYVGEGATFGGSINVGTDISFGGDLKKSGQSVNLITVYGKTASLPRPGSEGEVALVNGLSASVVGAGYGLYLWDGGFSFEYAGVTGSWIRITDRNGYRSNQDLNGDGIVDGSDLGILLAGWGFSGADYSLGGSLPMQMGIGDGLGNAFEIKIFGITSGKKSSAFRVTSNDSVPQIFMKAGTVDVDGNLVVKDLTSGIDSVLRVEGSRFSSAPLLRVVGAEGITGGYSIFQCGVVFDGGTANGMTFGSPVYMGATLTMNSNIRFNSGYGITGGFIDAGWY